MDNKLTKRRLSDYLSYEWILMIVVAVVMIVVWEFAYTVGAVRLTVGQDFKYYYDESISSLSATDFDDLLTSDGTFSYDVLKRHYETLTSDYNVLSIRLSIQEGDVLITDSKEPEEGATGDERLIRAKSAIDNFDYNIYCLDTMLSDAITYLNQFVDGEVVGNYQVDIAKLNDSKINDLFLERMKKDNRFRSEEQKQEGFKLEKGRIEKLLKEVSDFKYFLDNAPDSAFYRYTKYSQTFEYTENAEEKANYETRMNKEISEGRENARYAINAAGLTGGAHNPSEYFKMSGADNADNVVIMAFNFLEYQPHLQFEVISFFNTVIRTCSNFIPQ